MSVSAGKSDSNNIRKFHKSGKRSFSWVSRLLILFALLYLAGNAWIFFTRYEVASYQVQQGAIVTNNTYRGLIIRDETVYYADRDGYVNYYKKSGAKATVTEPICSVDATGTISASIQNAAEASGEIASAEYNELLDEIYTFASSYDPMNFTSVTSYKLDLATELNQSYSSQALQTLSAAILEASANNTFQITYLTSPGIVEYYVDGKEDLTTDNYTTGDLDSAGYSRTMLYSNESCMRNDPLFKTINSETWHVILQISDSLAGQLGGSGTCRIRFAKDNFTTVASYNLEHKDGEYFMNFRMKNGMIRYATERYVDVELELDEENGLKIPISAIAEKEYFKIPKEYFVKGGDSNNYGLLISERNGSTVFRETEVFYVKDNCYYIDRSSVTDGELVKLTETNATYTIGTDTEILKGVYNINKGYAVFRIINIVTQTDEYAIADMDSKISLYDYIALDASKVEEGQTVAD